jgi:hypothetical protein
MAGRFLTPIAATGLAMLATGAFAASPAGAADSGASSRAGSGAGSGALASTDSRAVVDPEAVVITRADAARAYRFDLRLPAGAHLTALTSDRSGPGSSYFVHGHEGGGDHEGGWITAETRGAAASGAAASGGVLVVDSAGIPIGAYDAPWASDARGRSLETKYRIEGHALIQTVAFDARTRFPVTIDPVYSAIGRPSATEFSAPGGTASGASTASGAPGAPVPGATAFGATGFGTTGFASWGRPSKVTVPANYVYNPALGSLHDYCTLAPDEFPAPGAPNADFRGPCARHDLCYAAGTTGRFSCDNTLLRNIYRNCEHYYGVFSLLRAACKTTALIYWAAVVAS